MVRSVEMFCFTAFLLYLSHCERFVYDDFQTAEIGKDWIHSEADIYTGRCVIADNSAQVHSFLRKSLMFDHSFREYAISRNAPFVHNGGDFIIQFSLQATYSNTFKGDYAMKLFQAPFDPHTLDENTTYKLAFGPYEHERRIAFSLRLPDPRTGESVLHNLTKQLRTEHGWDEHFYRLVIHPDDTFEIHSDFTVVLAGDLHDPTLFNPPIQPPEMINDPTDKIPENYPPEWIRDPKDKKPAYWVEGLPEQIPDPAQTKSEFWKEDEPEWIPDPDGKKPEEWNDETDGEYEVPLIRNPYCLKYGCGKYVQPMIPNPDYYRPYPYDMKRNPKYKPYKFRQIPNPDYYVAPNNLSIIGNISGIGFIGMIEQNKLMIQSIYIGDNVTEADEIRTARFGEQFRIQEAAKASQKRSDVQKRLERDVNRFKQTDFWKQPKRKISIGWDLLIDRAKEKKEWLYQFIALVAGVTIVGLIILIGCTCCIFKQCGKSKSNQPKTEESTKEEKEEEPEQAQESKAVVAPEENSDKTPQQPKRRPTRGRTPGKQ
ncbi:putative Calnexin like protein [Blattamonas nauphoetae]|uniref:Calnexin like protein n=1 Tax=Blattamonas nauphoetae TaxID=2049346 RepID=A0ABQ9XWJ6_9EUKA|nr:putative Calnexin like protein [Blattamonas nauphoetae]